MISNNGQDEQFTSFWQRRDYSAAVLAAVGGGLREYPDSQSSTVKGIPECAVCLNPDQRAAVHAPEHAEVLRVISEIVGTVMHA